MMEIRLKNFRQFYGDQAINVSTDPARNVTLIHAENGFGKTTLLNALLWCFYGPDATTTKFEQKDKLVNREALKEGEDAASVGVRFEHNGEHFYAQRQVVDGRRDGPFTVSEIRAGSHKGLPNPDAFINSVIPVGMAKYFFFDGEQAEAFSGETNNKTVGRAIRTMLGCDVAQTTVKDLEYLSRKFDEELARLPGESQIAARERDLSELEGRRTEVMANREQAQRRRDLFVETSSKLEEELRSVVAVAGLQRERELLQRQLAGVRARDDELGRRRNRWLAQRGMALVGERLSTDVTEVLERSDLTGIPSPYNEEFVRGILQKGICVCGREIAQGTHEYGCVASLLSSAPSNVVQSKAIRAKSVANECRRMRDEGWQELTQIEKDGTSNSDLEQELQRRLHEIGEKLDGHGRVDVREREATLRAAKEQIRQIDLELGKLSFQEVETDKEIRRTKASIDILVQEGSAGKPIVKRRQLCDSAVGILKTVLSEYEVGAREEITAKVNGVLGEAAHKDFLVEIAEDFSLTLLFSDGSETAKSGGENQLLSLAFIAALVRFSSERLSDEGGELLIPGTVAPLMLDSPFGQLDPKYRQAVASFAPAMSSQVLLLVSTAQGSRDVVGVLRPKVGQEYVLKWEHRDKQRTMIEKLR